MDQESFDHVEPDLSPTPARQIRFCLTCGAAWQAEWTECPSCSSGRVKKSEDASQAYHAERKSLRSALGLYFALLTVCLAAYIVVMVSKEQFSVAGELTLDLIMATLTIAWAARWYRRLLPSLLKTGGARWLLLAVPCGIGSFCVAHGVVTGINHLFDLPTLEYLTAYREEGFGIWLAIISICVMPAVFEELAFRGVILSAVGDFLSPTESVMVSALMFAILHLSVPSIPHLFLLGAIAAVMRLRSGSLIPGMIVHFTHNLLVLLSERSGSMLPW